MPLRANCGEDPIKDPVPPMTEEYAKNRKKKKHIVLGFRKKRLLNYGVKTNM
jgi:hypothetical protein